MRGNGTFASDGEAASSNQRPAGRTVAATADAGPRITFATRQRQLDERTRVLGVEGELDLASAPNLKWALADALSGGTNQLVVDLAAVRFIDSTALGVLVGVHRGLDAGARMAIVCTHPDVLNIFELTGLDATFDIFRNLDDALAHVRGSADTAG